jgi:serine/threonine protein kinase
VSGFGGGENIMEEMIGEVVGRYRIEAHIGEGGMAAVYRAYDERLDRQVAIKFIRFSGSTESISPDSLKRFEREARALAKLSHPNIVKVYDYGEHKGVPYLVMEYLMGGTLRQRTGYPMNYREAAKLLLPIARALDYAHRQGIIHRDVKPSNILLTESGEPMLSDFGIAKLVYSKETISLTGEGVSVGTPEYIAPEQSVGAELDQRADIYSLGVILYELITGRKPYTAETPVAVMVKHVVEPLPHPKAYVADLPEEVEAVVIKALAKKPQDRYSTMADFAQVLESLLHAPSGDKAGSELKAALQQPTQPSDVQAVKSKVQEYEPTIDSYLSQWEEKPSTPEQLPSLGGRPVMGAERKTPPSYPSINLTQPTEAADSQKARPWLPLGALALGVVFVILLIGGAIIWILRPQPEPQQLTVVPATQEITSVALPETATIRPSDTATHSPARVEAMTLIAEKTSVKETIEQPEEDSKASYLLFGPANGRLVHQTSSDGCLPNMRCAPLQQSAGVKVRDFIAQATFYNPYPIKQGIWDIGFFFRSKSPDEGYRLIVRADSRWELREKSPDDDYVVASGKLPPNILDDTSGRTNQLKLLVYQKQGYLVVNDRNIVALNLR